MTIKPYLWAEWTPVACRRRWWMFRVWNDPSRYRCLYVMFGLHWFVQLAAWAVHRWQVASHEPSWLERKAKD